MACVHLEGLTLTAPTPAQSVYREDCTQCFDSIDDPSGLDVCLQCFNGGCTGDRNHASLHQALWQHPLVLNIRRTRMVVVRDEPPPKMSKLAIAAETEEDRYNTETLVKCLECQTDLDKSHPKLAPMVEGILKANTFARKEEVKAWELDLVSCEHILQLQQGDGTVDLSDQGHCASCDLKENLWLCLECGNLGCGRKQLGGADGNSHALAHSDASSHGVAVKLGSITPEGSADVYCYKCDEERKDDDLGHHLEHWGIILAERQKVEKSLTEMQIEQNLKWDFSMTTEDGKELKPLFGPGLTGLKNLGNSCYLASIIQCLFDMPSFQARYFNIANELPVVSDPATDLETQLRKIGDGLLSGRYSKPDPDLTVTSEHSNEVLQHQKGLSPAMFKHLIGRGHVEFSTMRQQDAHELYQHLFELISRTQHPDGLGDPTLPFRFAMEERLQCLACKKVRYTTTEQDNIMIEVPLEKLPAEAIEVGQAPTDQFRAVTLKECLDSFTREETVELTCSSCKSKDGYSKRSLFKTLPEIFVVNARKMAIINRVPHKIDVPVIVPDGAFLMDEYFSPGLQPSEEVLEDEPEPAAPSFAPNPEALGALLEMGLPQNRCERALQATGNSDANAAMIWLCDHSDDPDIDMPISSADNAGQTADPEKMKTICEFTGASIPQARKALKETGGNVEAAMGWIMDHPDDQGMFEEDAPKPVTGADGNKEPAGTAAVPAQYQLQSIVCHKGTSIHAGHYVSFIRKDLGNGAPPSWVLFNDEKVVEAADVEEMRKFAYIYFFRRV